MLDKGSLQRHGQLVAILANDVIANKLGKQGFGAIARFKKGLIVDLKLIQAEVGQTGIRAQPLRPVTAARVDQLLNGGFADAEGLETTDIVVPEPTRTPMRSQISGASPSALQGHPVW